MENINVDYSSFGSPTGVNTDLYVDFKDKWVNIIPHLSIGFSFTLADWIKISVSMFNFVYVPSLKKVLVNIDFFGFHLYF